MLDWVSLFERGDLTGVILALILAMVAGGVFTSVITSFAASRRGIKGDALVKESNGITGLTNLSAQQGDFITSIRDQMKTDRDEFKRQLDALRQETNVKIESLKTQLEEELKYSNSLIFTLQENTIPVPPRPSPLPGI